MSRGTGIVKTGKQHPLRLKIKNIRGSDREEQERLSKQASKALDDEEEYYKKREKNMKEESKDVTLSGRNSIEPDISKKQEAWKMNKELKNAIAKAIKASRAQIISTYGKPIHPGKVNPNLNEDAITKVRRILKKG